MDSVGNINVAYTPQEFFSRFCLAQNIFTFVVLRVFTGRRLQVSDIVWKKLYFNTFVLSLFYSRQLPSLSSSGKSFYVNLKLSLQRISPTARCSGSIKNSPLCKQMSSRTVGVFLVESLGGRIKRKAVKQQFRNVDNFHI